jgi:hypothetical protein
MFAEEQLSHITLDSFPKIIYIPIRPVAYGTSGTKRTGGQQSEGSGKACRHKRQVRVSGVRCPARASHA